MTDIHRRDERGAATAFVVGMAVTLIVMAGLVADGGGALNARQRLADDVEHAALAAAQQTDELRVRTEGVLVIDPGAAEQAAHDYLAGRGYHGIVITPNETTVSVHAQLTLPTKTLLLIGVNQFNLEATAVAEAEQL